MRLHTFSLPPLMPFDRFHHVPRGCLWTRRGYSGFTAGEETLHTCPRALSPECDPALTMSYLSLRNIWSLLDKAMGLGGGWGLGEEPQIGFGVVGP